MKRIWILFIAVTLVSFNCSGQVNENKSADLNSPNNAPQEEVTVNKEYDEDGNLISYDSTYTYFYSNIENDPMLQDSIYEDSLLKYDFYKRDFFLERFKQNGKRAEEMFQKMDSVKNAFFLDEYPK